MDIQLDLPSGEENHTVMCLDMFMKRIGKDIMGRNTPYSGKVSGIWNHNDLGSSSLSVIH